MKGTMITFKNTEAASKRTFTRPPELEEMQAALGGGYLEVVPYFDTIEIGKVTHKCRAFCDEEGKLKRLPVNGMANIYWQMSIDRNKGPRIVDVLVGPVIVLYGDAAFMNSL